jgi:hypothetical protein
MRPSLSDCLGRKLSGSRRTYGLGQTRNYTRDLSQSSRKHSVMTMSRHSPSTN